MRRWVGYQVGGLQGSYKGSMWVVLGSIREGGEKKILLRGAGEKRLV